MNNIDQRTVSSFGDEWESFDQSNIPSIKIQQMFDEYFSIFPWYLINDDSEGFDMGCGSGRWARLVLPRVGHLHCIDPSSAIEVARINLANFHNVSFHEGIAGGDYLPKSSQDFGYSLGVLHHVPDTAKAIQSCVDLLKPGAPLLLYLYYKFDNRSLFYRSIWRVSDVIRRATCHLPSKIKIFFTDIIAAVIYLPLAKLSYLLDRVGFDVSSIPLSYYRNHTFYTMRTDSRDRFGTPLEKRFTKLQIKEMLKKSGLTDIRFSSDPPYWCVVGIKL